MGANQPALDVDPSIDAIQDTPVPHSTDGNQAAPAPHNTDTNGDVNAPYGLTTAEQNWRQMQVDLEGRGYMLRRRYHEGWVGSWVGTKKRPERCEDSIGISAHGIVIDAVRISDGALVMLKLWTDNERDAMELPVLQYFSDPSRATDPQNHCIPLLEVVDIPDFEDYFDHILVEPLLRASEEPPFLIVAEALSWIHQALEGLVYMHSHNVAHGDIHAGNIMMDPSRIFPNGFNGAFNFDANHRLSERGVKRLTRLRSPVKYYYIDFGSSNMFSSSEARQPVVFNAAVWVPPEVEAAPDTPYDAFKADVYALGVTILSTIRHRPELQSILAVLAKMIDKTPDQRPTAQEALDTFRGRILQRMSRRQMRRRLSYDTDVEVRFLTRLWHWKEYVRLLWDAYRHGLPRDILLDEGTA